MMKKFFGIFVLSISLVFCLEVNAATKYRVLFDENYGYGLECEAPTSWVRDGVCSGEVDSGTEISFPSNSKNMVRSGEGMLIGWTKTLDDGIPYCAATYDGSNYNNYVISYDSKYKVDSNVDFYACYHSDIYGFRYTLSGASADGQNLPCGSYLGITYCTKNSDGNEYCYYDMNGETPATGTVYRDKLALSKPSNCKEESTEQVETLNKYMYGVKESIRDINFECGARLYITTCTGNICNFTKVKTSDGVESSVTGTVNKDTLLTSESKAKKQCPNEKQELKNCITKPQKKVDNEPRKFSVCYSSKYSDTEVREMINDTNKSIVSCAKGYQLDTTATRASGKETCDSKNCIREYTVQCVNKESNNPRNISVSVGFEGYNSNGEGTVKIKATSKVGDIVGYYLSEKYVAPTTRSNWEDLNTGNFSLTMSPGVKYLWVKDSNGTISNSITVTVNDRNNTKNTLKTLELYDSNNNLNGLTRISYVSDEVSMYQKLSNKLESDNKVIASGFNAFDHEYKLEVDSPTITVYATLTSSDAKFVPGYEPRTVNLKYGVNTILIKILDNEGKERRYTILVTRTDDRDSDNTLNNIETSVGDFTFNANVTDYKIEIPSSTDSVNVKSTINSDKSSYVEGFEPGDVKITGDTTVKLIKVKSQTGTVRTYVLSFIKEGTDRIVNESLQLFGLTIPGVNVAFDPEIANYNITVGYTKDVIDIYAPLKDENSTVIFRSKKANDTEFKTGSNLGVTLDEGVNFVEIKIIDKAGNSSYYRLVIIRKEFGLDVSDDTALKDLKVLNYNIDFEPNKKEYTVKIKNEKTLVITAVPLSNRAEVFIKGNEELTGFSTVRVQVVAENGEYDTYSIDIVKDAFNKSIEVASIIAGSVIILISSCIIVIKKRTKSRREYFEE